MTPPGPGPKGCRTPVNTGHFHLLVKSDDVVASHRVQSLQCNGYM